MNAPVQSVAVAAAVATLCLPCLAHESAEKLADPGFRPKSEHSDAFLEKVSAATVVVYPSIVRTAEGTVHSSASQQAIVAGLNEGQVTTALADPGKVDPGELEGTAQWEMFQHDLEIIGTELKNRETDADYRLVMEFLLSPRRSGGLNVFGIHCYVLDRQGRNAFSFLLNSHHQILVDANLSAEDASEAARNALVDKATPVGVAALVQQLHFAEHRVTN